MRKLKIVLAFISIFAWRWYYLPSPLPKDWESESRVSLTVTVLEAPEYTDSKTIVRNGIWYISMKSYSPIIPGSRVKFVGRVEPKKTLLKVTQVIMLDPSMEVVEVDDRCFSCRLLIGLGELRGNWVGILGKALPEPMASLSAGILLWVKGQMPQDFYQSLVTTGTLHIVAASGYNVSIVSSVLMNILAVFVSKGIGIGVGIVVILLYVLMSGGSASVVRAGIMGSLTLIAYYFGRPTEARRLLFITGGIMLIANPLMLVDIGFQLSFGATLGLLYIGELVERSGNWLFRGFRSYSGVMDFLAEYLYPTLAATLATLPVILWHFGRVSWISPLVNILVLPLIPLIMGMTALVLGIGMIASPLGLVLAWLTYVPLAWVVWIITIFGRH